MPQTQPMPAEAITRESPADPAPGQALRADFDAIEASIAHRPQAELPVTHRFTPGLYIREILIPAGTVLSSMVHKTEHPFVITRGRIRVISEAEGCVEYVAPHTGITRPGTRRLLYALEDTVWTTFHPTELTDVEAIAAAILEPSPNRLIPGDDPRLNLWRDSAVDIGLEAAEALPSP